MSENVFNKNYKYEIFIGLKDKDSYEELFSINDFKNILSEICVEEKIGFSLISQVGGYTHNKGYTTETSVRIIIIGITEEEATILAERLKSKVNTDTVLITKTLVESCFI